MYPKWTVMYWIKNTINDKYLGTGIEFFDDENDAKKCYESHLNDDMAVVKRPFFPTLDKNRMNSIDLLNCERASSSMAEQPAHNR